MLYISSRISMEPKKIYKTLIEAEKSKFYVFLTPLKDVTGFKELLTSIKKEHKKAKHVVYAYRCGNLSKSCDDKEPKGTAGRPILEFMFKKELENCAIFVVRYFGGVKLGASRLLRTYLQCGIEVTKLFEKES